MNEGRVLATGPGRRNLSTGEVIPVSVKEGDKVLLPEYGGQTLRLDNTECAPAAATRLPQGGLRALQAPLPAVQTPGLAVRQA